MDENNKKNAIKLGETKTSMINFVVRHPYSIDLKLLFEKKIRDAKIIIDNSRNNRTKTQKKVEFFNQIPMRIKYDKTKNPAKLKIFTKNNFNITCCQDEKSVQKVVKILINYLIKIEVLEKTVKIEDFKISLDLLNCDSKFKIGKRKINTRKLFSLIEKETDGNILQAYLTSKMLLQITVCIPQNNSDLWKKNTSEVQNFLESNKIDKKIISLLCLESNVIGRTLCLIDKKYFHVINFKNKDKIKEFTDLISNNLRKVIILIYNSGFCRVTGAHSYEEIDIAENIVEKFISSFENEVIYSELI